MRRLPIVAALALGALLVAESALRPRLAALDAYQYADVAQNLAAGRGLTQSVLGYNAAVFPSEGEWPAPFTSQPPLYPALAAIVIRLGVPAAGALAALAALALVAAWLAAAALARRMGGEEAATLTLLGLAACGWSTQLSPRVWSEPLGVAFTLAALVALSRGTPRAASAAQERNASAPRFAAPAWALAAGLLAGAAFATRYALAPLAALGLAWLALAPRPARPARVLAFALGWGAIAAPILARNHALTGGWLGEARNPSAEPLGQVVAGAFALTLGRISAPALVALVFATLALVLLLARDRERREQVRAALAADAGLLPAWIALYAVSVLLLRARVQFDAVGFRLLTPAIAAGVPFAAGVLVAVFRPARRVFGPVVTLALVATAIHVGVRLADTPPVDEAARIARSPALLWLAEHTRPGDPVIAEDAVDFAWALRDPASGSRRFASFSPAPYMRPLTRDDLARFAARHATAGGAPLRVLVRTREASEDEWRKRYGDLVTRAMADGTVPGSGLALEADLRDARIFRWEPPGRWDTGATKRRSPNLPLIEPGAMNHEGRKKP